MLSAERTFCGRLFQTSGAADANRLAPNAVRDVGLVSKPRLDDRNDRLGL